MLSHLHQKANYYVLENNTSSIIFLASPDIQCSVMMASSKIIN